MLPDFTTRLRVYADVIVRVGLNLQRGQRLLLAEPYELQGVARSAEVLVEAVRSAAGAAGSPGAAAIEVVLLWGAIVATLVAFLRVDRTAGLLMAPYLAWVSFASVLNFAVWHLNH